MLDLNPRLYFWNDDISAGHHEGVVHRTISASIEAVEPVFSLTGYLLPLMWRSASSTTSRRLPRKESFGKSEVTSDLRDVVI